MSDETPPVSGNRWEQAHQPVEPVLANGVAEPSADAPWQTRARAVVAGADVPSHAGRGAVRQEDAQPHRGLQHHRSDALPGELRRPEMAHDRGVREQEQRLGHQRQERRHREPQDLPVVRLSHGSTVAQVMISSGK